VQILSLEQYSCAIYGELSLTNIIQGFCFFRRCLFSSPLRSASPSRNSSLDVELILSLSSISSSAISSSSSSSRSAYDSIRARTKEEVRILSKQCTALIIQPSVIEHMSLTVCQTCRTFPSATLAINPSYPSFIFQEKSETEALCPP